MPPDNLYMINRIRRTAAIMAAGLATLGVVAVPALANGSESASTPGAFNGSQMIAHGNSTVFSQTEEACMQVREADGSFINQAGSCQVYYNVPANGPAITIGSYVDGHIYRSWAWSNQSGAATSGWFTP
jgi:hypothetical protein